MLETKRSKYQFSILFANANTNNAASTKAVLDCNQLFLNLGYEDYTLIFNNKYSKINYWFSVSKGIAAFLFTIKKNSIVGIQYPLLNNVFKYFIKAARLKNVRFFCIIHDVETLRTGGRDKVLVNQELSNLNYYDYLIVHNEAMLKWLRENGVTTKMYPLVIFDYLTSATATNNTISCFSKTIVFAGNLTKSSFIYQLDKVNWKFNVYGSNFNNKHIKLPNVEWRGQFSPEQIVHKLNGDFGLIWDGDTIDKCDAVLGNYLRYNNPHKFSLYLAAGLPVIAPKDAAIAHLITKYNIGILIESLYDLNDMNVLEEDYQIMKKNCLAIGKDIINGNFFTAAIKNIEEELIA